MVWRRRRSRAAKPCVAPVVSWRGECLEGSCDLWWWLCGGDGRWRWIFIDSNLFSRIFIDFMKCIVLKLQALAWKDNDTRGNSGNTEYLIESGADLISRRVFESNITAVLAQSPYKTFHNVDFVFFPIITTKRSHHFYLMCFNMKTAEIDIIDNLNNDVDDIGQRYVKCNKLMVDTDSKLKIALSLNLEDKELKKMIEERNNLFLDFYKELDNNVNVEGEEIDGDKNWNTNETKCDTDREEVDGTKDECEEHKGNEEQQETDRKSNKDESHNEAEHNESDNIENIGNLSLSAGHNTTINAPVESSVNAIVESIDNVVDVLPQICVDAQNDKNLYAKETEAIEKQQKEKIMSQHKPETKKGTAKKQVEVEKAKVLEKTTSVEIGKEKHIVKPSSNFYDRRVKISKPLSEEEKKLVEYIWSDRCPEGQPLDLVEEKNKVNERRRIFDENVAIIFENSKKKNFNHVDLVSFFPCMKDSNRHYIIYFNMKNAEIDTIDNINNDVDDISVRYGAYAMALNVN
ncbi:hypothetical protein Tco_0260227 [Tanacetum coccineum]